MSREISKSPALAAPYNAEYWIAGTQIVKAARKKTIEEASGSDWYSHAPMGMAPETARGYLAGMIDAYQHALEMMGYGDGT